MDIFQTTIRQTLYGQNMDNVVGWTTSGSLDTDGIQDATDTILNQWNTNVKPLQVVGVTLVSADTISLINPTEGAHSTVENLAGVNVPALPTFVCVKVNLNTGLRGRSYRGRMGIGGVAEQDTEPLQGNQLTAAAQGRWQNGMSTFAGATNAALQSELADGLLAVISQFHIRQKRNPPIATPYVLVDVPLGLGSRNGRKP